MPNRARLTSRQHGCCVSRRGLKNHRCILNIRWSSQNHVFLAFFASSNGYDHKSRKQPAFDRPAKNKRSHHCSDCLSRCMCIVAASVRIPDFDIGCDDASCRPGDCIEQSKRSVRESYAAIAQSLYPRCKRRHCQPPVATCLPSALMETLRTSPWFDCD